MKYRYLYIVPLMFSGTVFTKVTVDQEAIKEMVRETRDSLKVQRPTIEKPKLEMDENALQQSIKDSLKDTMKLSNEEMKKDMEKRARESIEMTLVPQCAPPRELIPFPTNMNTGRYYRFSPDGNKVIISSGSIEGHHNNIGIINISLDAKGRSVTQSLPTLMYDETYPVEGVKNSEGKYEWQIMTSPYDPRAGGLGFYEFGSGTKNDVLQNGETAAHIYSDPTHDEYYHSAAAAPTASGDTSNFRVMLWRDQKMKDYQVVKNPDGTSKIIEKSKTYNPCKNLDTISGPIISKDSSMIGFSEHGDTVIYKINHETKKCRLVRKVGYSTGKVSFNYPDQEPVVAFGTETNYESDGNFRRYRAIQTFNYGADGLDDIDRIKNVTDPEKDNAMSYAGMLADGRVMYITYRETVEEDGYIDGQYFIVRADPKQLNNDGSINLDAAKNDQCAKTLQPYKKILDKKKTEASSQVISQ